MPRGQEAGRRVPPKQRSTAITSSGPRVGPGRGVGGVLNGEGRGASRCIEPRADGRSGGGRLLGARLGRLQGGSIRGRASAKYIYLYLKPRCASGRMRANPPPLPLPPWAAAEGRGWVPQPWGPGRGAPPAAPAAAGGPPGAAAGGGAGYVRPLRGCPGLCSLGRWRSDSVHWSASSVGGLPWRAKPRGI